MRDYSLLWKEELDFVSMRGFYLVPLGRDPLDFHNFVTDLSRALRGKHTLRKNAYPVLPRDVDINLSYHLRVAEENLEHPQMVVTLLREEDRRAIREGYRRYFTPLDEALSRLGTGGMSISTELFLHLQKTLAVFRKHRQPADYSFEGLVTDFLVQELLEKGYLRRYILSRVIDNAKYEFYLRKQYQQFVSRILQRENQQKQSFGKKITLSPTDQTNEQEIVLSDAINGKDEVGEATDYWHVGLAQLFLKSLSERERCVLVNYLRPLVYKEAEAGTLMKQAERLCGRRKSTIYALVKSLQKRIRDFLDDFEPGEQKEVLNVILGSKLE